MASSPLAHDEDEQNKENTHNEKFYCALRNELMHAKEQGFQISVRKTTFVTALLGLGSINLQMFTKSGEGGFYQLLWVAPAASVFFDILELEQKYTVRRIGAFLKSVSSVSAEKRWEKWLPSKRGGIFMAIGDRGFTAMTFAASILVLDHQQKDCDTGIEVLRTFSSATQNAVIKGINKLSSIDDLTKLSESLAAILQLSKGSSEMSCNILTSTVWIWFFGLSVFWIAMLDLIGTRLASLEYFQKDESKSNKHYRKYSITSTLLYRIYGFLPKPVKKVAEKLWSSITQHWTHFWTR